MSIDTQQAALDRLRSETVVNRRTLTRLVLPVAVASMLFMTLLQVVIYLLLGEAETETALWRAVGLGVAFGALFPFLILLFRRGVTKHITAMQRAHVHAWNKKGIDVRLGSTRWRLPLTLPRNQRLIRPGDRIWIPDPLSTTERPVIVATPDDRPDGVVLWPNAPAEKS